MELKMPPSPSKPPHRKVVPAGSNIQEMIQKLKTASNSTEMENGCQSLSRYFNHEVKVRKKQISEQMESLRKEKDSALNQYVQREEDVKRLKHQLDHVKTEYKLVDKQRVKTLQAQLQAAITDRDDWIKKAVELDDVVESLQLVNTLQKSLLNEGDVITQYEQRLIEEKKQIKILAAERDDLRHKLIQEKDRVNSLQRLIEILKNEVVVEQDSSYV